jgi:hypothetical protein
MKTRDRADTTIVPLRRPYPEIALGMLLFTACAAFFAHRASTNDRGLILNGIIHFDPGGADTFYAVMAGLSLCFAGLAVAGALRVSQIKAFRILVGAKSVTFPAGPLYRAKEVTVPLDRIVAVETHPAAKPVTLVVREDDAAYAIPSRWFTAGWSAPEAAEVIITQVRRGTTS